MMKHFTILLLLLSIAFSQSAYNRLGFGEVLESSSVFSSSIGYASIAFYDSTKFIPDNPASWHNLGKVYYSVSMGSNLMDITEKQNDAPSRLYGDTQIEHLSVAFPLGSRIGMSVGIEPVTFMQSEYEMQSSIGRVVEEVEGGTWNYYVGFGASITRNLSIGIRSNLLNGIYERNSLIYYDDDYTNRDTVDIARIEGNLSGKSITFGIQSGFGENILLGVAYTYPVETPEFNGDFFLSDTYQSITLSEAYTAWPSVLKIGLSYKYSERTTFLGGMSQYFFADDTFDDMKILTIPEGWSIQPIGSFQFGVIKKAKDISSRHWLNRLGWQTGLMTRNFYISPSSTQLIYEYFITGGLSFPLRDGRTRFNLSTELGSRNGVEDLPDELIFRMRFGVELNDLWFKKIKRR